MGASRSDESGSLLPGVTHTCHPDGECFCVYEALSGPTPEALEIARLRRIIGLLYEQRGLDAGKLRQRIRAAFLLSREVDS
jgi:hypothetical protein